MNKLAVVPALKTAGVLSGKYTGASIWPCFFGAGMTALPITGATRKKMISQNIKSVTSNLYFYNQIAVKISFKASVSSHDNAMALHGHQPDVSLFAGALIDRALKRELDSEISVMARGENVAANQRRRNMLGKYLLTKPYHVIKNFYGVQMQKIAAGGAPSEAEREETGFHSDIIQERTNKTVYSKTQTQTEHITAKPPASAALTDRDLNRIAAQAAEKVERKMRAERERNGKW